MQCSTQKKRLNILIFGAAAGKRFKTAVPAIAEVPSGRADTEGNRS
jgi:hypothetical protein